jgi:predicted DNA-binding protein (UPF0251 family)
MEPRQRKSRQLSRRAEQNNDRRSVRSEPNQARKFDPRYVVVAFTETGALTYTGLTPAGLRLVTTYAKDGHNVDSCARALGIGRSTFADLRKRNADVADAWASGRAILDDEVNDTLLRHMREGSLPAAIFYAKGRLHWRETGPADPSAQQGPTVNITLNAPMSDADFARLINPVERTDD